MMNDRAKSDKTPGHGIIAQCRSASALISVLAAIGGPALAADPVDLASGGTYEFYGQLSPSYLTFDDGGQSYGEFVDNTNSNSRIGMWFRRTAPWGRLNINVETSLGFRGTDEVSQTVQARAWDWTTASIRKAEVIWETDRIGTIYLGQGSMASDGIANRDLAGTSIVSYVGIPDVAGVYFLRTESGGLSSVAIAEAFPNFDGARRTRVRYDSPSFRGLVVSASVGQQVLSNEFRTKDSDFTVRYDRDGPRFRISAASGYTWIGRKTLPNNRTAVGSISIEHKATGLSITSSTGKRDTAGNYRYLKLSYKSGLSRAGPFSVSFDYYAANNMVSGGSRSKSYGVGILQKFANPRVEAYLGLRSYRYTDPSAVKYQDAHSVLLGARWKF